MQPVPPPPARRPQTLPLFLPIMLTVIAAALLLPAAWLARQTISYRAEAERVTGTVIALQRSGRNSARPVIGYTVDDRKHEMVSEVWQSPPAYDVGDEVELLYFPDSPGDARIDSFIESWFVPMMFGGFGLALLLSAL